ncbi:hypothetical protein [Segetibacter koreensis]|uniref:hypothetical protein n=1 Tax=Segetibacter koreensis TaxID=398037 RepID=UPI00037AF119|nr:hypothetical protein [Segetibacter koreensis]
MTYKSEPLNDLHEIKQMMERSSRFISLSGWSGIAAGTCALIGSFFGHIALKENYYSVSTSNQNDYTYFPFLLKQLWYDKLFHIALITFIAAFVSAFIFTYARSRKNNTPVWSPTSRRLLINVCIPMIVGGIFLLKLIENGTYGLIAPGCLIFYGLALINGSKYTVGEIKYLGYSEIFLGVVNCWFIGLGLYFWAVGFGVLHIIYGTLMLLKYERSA